MRERTERRGEDREERTERMGEATMASAAPSQYTPGQTQYTYDSYVDEMVRKGSKGKEKAAFDAKEKEAGFDAKKKKAGFDAKEKAGSEAETEIETDHEQQDRQPPNDSAPVDPQFHSALQPPKTWTEPLEAHLNIWST